MSVLIVHDDGLIALTPAADYTAKTGYLIGFSGDTATVTSHATTVEPTGVIVEPNVTTAGFATEKVTVALLGPVGGTIRVKTSGAITKGAKVKQAADGTIITDAAGARWVIGTACESGVSGDLIEVAPHAAQYYAS